jgi:hypothetical protein
MKPPKSTDSLNAERLKMENLGRGFIIFLVAALIFAGRYFFNF